MNVLYISDSDSKYGASKSMLYTLKGLKQLYGDKVKIYLLIPFKLRHNRHMYEAYCEKVICKVFGQYCQSRPYSKLVFPIKVVLKYIEYAIGTINIELFLNRSIKFDEIDLIHSNSSRDDIGIRLARKYNKRLIWHIREYGDSDFNCFHFRNDYIDLMNDSRTLLVAVSDSVRNHWINRGIIPNKIITIYNGIACEKCRDYGCFQGERIKILMLGGISEAKCQKHLIEAIALMDNYTKSQVLLDIVGDGNKKYMSELKKLVKKYNLGTVVKFIGYVPNPEKIIGQYDVGVICSKSEAFGRVTVEYMMHGLLVVASDSGANKEIIREGVDGFIYKWGDCENLAQCIKRIISDKRLIPEFGGNAHERAVNDFSSEKNIRKIFYLYSEFV
ncbi:glycosyltransferase family 4 protein [Butyrivibrio sp. NC3005]|uniref:glycosyltransferase family 4 protein n=1 Tax=Butyrivibrio sp. NC3005 TaxID=1280685 RepID=UPI0004098109|nr:glycosyltransferase family 4 protein [Butyrivibrio sp. NC3005]